MILISDTNTLSDFCKKVSKSSFICIDTEFLREKSYWSQLCLVQISGENDDACIDPLAEDIDLTPLFELLQNPKVLKVFHAARQDIEIFFNLTGETPKPIFDTQIAAMVCGFGDSVGYKTLVTKLAKVNINKTVRFSDWSRRPLSEKQLKYAISDVTHLRTVYKKLKKQLAKNKRESWLEEETAYLTAKDTYEINIYDAWQRIKAHTRDRKTLAVLREVAAWREKEAQEKDIPRRRLLRDEALVEIASSRPKTVEDLDKVRMLPKGYAEGRHGQALLEAVEKADNLDKKEWPATPKKKRLPPGNHAIEELLKVLLKIKSDENKVAVRLIASSEDIEKIAAYKKPDVPALKGWRKKIYGNDALRLKKGQIAISYDTEKRKIVLIETEQVVHKKQ